MRGSTTLGQWAQLVFLSLVAGSIGGVLWGLTRPGYVGTVSEGGFVIDELASAPNVEFSSFGWFVLLSAVLGIAVAVFAFLRERAGFVALVSVVACAGAAAFALHTFGGWSASMLHPAPHDPATADGQVLTIVPPLAPGVAWLAGPFVAGLMFYLLNLVSELRASSAT